MLTEAVTTQKVVGYTADAFCKEREQKKLFEELNKEPYFDEQFSCTYRISAGPAR